MNYAIAGMGYRIADARRKNGLSQAQLADQLDITVKHLSEVERGLKLLSLERLVSLCDLLDLSLDYIVRGQTHIKENSLPPYIQIVYEVGQKDEVALLNEYLNLYAKIREADKPT